jgi:hypothetical protein
LPQRRLSLIPQAEVDLLGGGIANLMELRKQCAWSATRPELFYWRTASGQEVDIVLEDRSRKVVGVEGKAAATLGNNDLRGLHASLSCQFMQRPFSQIEVVPLACERTRYQNHEIGTAEIDNVKGRPVSDGRLQLTFVRR